MAQTLSISFYHKKRKKRNHLFWVKTNTRSLGHENQTVFPIKKLFEIWMHFCEPIERWSKLKDGPMQDENFGTKQYLKEYRLNEARTFFKFRSKMLDFKFNYKSNPSHSRELWKCDSCQSAIETQEHILWCPAYQELREGKSLDNDKDLVGYFVSVMKIRENLNLKKWKMKPELRRAHTAEFWEREEVQINWL